LTPSLAEVTVGISRGVFNHKAELPAVGNQAVRFSVEDKVNLVAAEGAFVLMALQLKPEWNQ
jgi:hypothetical protein